MKNGAFLYHGTQQDVRSSTEESKDGDTIKTMTAWQSPETPDNGGELLFQRAVRRLQEASRVDRFRETGNRTVGVRGSVGGEAGGIESLSLGRWRVLAIVCTMTWVYLTLLNRILKIMRMVNFMLRVFSTIKKGKKESDRPTWHIMKDRRGDIHGASRSGHFHTWSLMWSQETFKEMCFPSDKWGNAGNYWHRSFSQKSGEPRPTEQICFAHFTSLWLPFLLGLFKKKKSLHC